MASRIDDRWLWLGAGVFFLAAASYIKHALTDIVRLTELDPAQFPASDSEHDIAPEASVDIQTLKTLSDSPNPSIAAAAQSLVIRRFANQPDAPDILRKDMASTDPDVSRRARQAVQYLYDYDVVVRDLLASMGAEDPDLPDQYADQVRFQDEDGRVQVMSVDEWDQMARMRNQQQDVLDAAYATESTADVVARLAHLSAEIARTELDTDNLHAIAGQARFAGWDRIPAPPRTTSFQSGDEGSNRRRRHREAMVLHEGGGSIEEDDIIRPAQSRWP